MHSTYIIGINYVKILDLNQQVNIKNFRSFHSPPNVIAFCLGKFNFLGLFILFNYWWHITIFSWVLYTYLYCPFSLVTSAQHLLNFFKFSVLEKGKSSESNVSLSNWTILQIDYWCRAEYIKHSEWHFCPRLQAFQVDDCSN